MPDKATFHAAFEDGASVTITIDYDVFKKTPQLNWMDAEWEGKPGPVALAQYREWMHTVMGQVSNRVNQEICLGLTGPGEPVTRRTPVFRYYPDGRHEQIQIPFQ